MLFRSVYLLKEPAFSFIDFCYLFTYFIYFWLHQVLVEACGIFIEACGIFRCGTWASLKLWCADFLFSSCGAQALGCVGSVVVAQGFQSAWAL